MIRVVFLHQKLRIAQSLSVVPNRSPPVVTDDPPKSHRWTTEVASAPFTVATGAKILIPPIIPPVVTESSAFHCPAFRSYFIKIQCFRYSIRKNEYQIFYQEKSTKIQFHLPSGQFPSKIYDNLTQNKIRNILHIQRLQETRVRKASLMLLPGSLR